MPDAADAELELPVLMLAPILVAIDEGGRVVFARDMEGRDISVDIDAGNAEPCPRSVSFSPKVSGSATNA